MLKIFRTAIRRTSARSRAKFDYARLRSMDDHMLRDIGVTRADIDAAMRRRRFVV